GVARVLAAGAGSAAAARREAPPAPAGLRPPAPRRRLAEVVADRGQDPRGHHQVAVELVPLLHPVAWVEQVLLAHPRRRRELHWPGQEVLHEDPAGTGRLVPAGRELVADTERVGEVVQA